MAKLTFVESKHPQMLSYIACQSTPRFYLVEEVEEPEEPEQKGIDLDRAAGLAYFGMCMIYAACFIGALLADF